MKLSEFKKEVERRAKEGLPYLHIRLNSGEIRAITDVFENGDMFSGNRLIQDKDYSKIEPLLHNAKGNYFFHAVSGKKS